jgi:hypothetical protein
MGKIVGEFKCSNSKTVVWSFVRWHAFNARLGASQTPAGDAQAASHAGIAEEPEASASSILLDDLFCRGRVFGTLL